MSDQRRRGKTRAPEAGFKEPFLHKYILLWICKRTFEFPIEASFEGDPLRNDLALTDPPRP
jgi:hypothetical protein